MYNQQGEIVLKFNTNILMFLFMFFTLAVSSCDLNMLQATDDMRLDWVRVEDGETDVSTWYGKT